MTKQTKRRHERIHFERHVQIDFFTEVYNQCHVKNISLSGMFVTGNFADILDEQCYVNLVQKGDDVYLKLEVLAKVVRQDTDGIGLQFISMSYESLMSLEMILLFQEKEKSEDAEYELPEELPFEINEEVSNSMDKYNPFLDQAE